MNWKNIAGATCFILAILAGFHSAGFVAIAFGLWGNREGHGFVPVAVVFAIIYLAVTIGLVWGGRRLLRRPPA